MNELTNWLADDAVTWIDVDGLGDADVIARIGEQFAFHPLSLEDVLSLHQRPKAEIFADYLFLVTRVHQAGSLHDSRQVSIFLGPNYVVSFRESGIEGFPDIYRRVVAGTGRIREHGADYLIYSLLDAVVDSFFPLLEDYGEQIDRLDDEVSTGRDHAVIRQLHDLRSDLLAIRRSVWPLRNAINTLIRDSGALVSAETGLYLRDCYDHTVQIIDVIETDRELCGDLRDYYLTVVSNRMNQVMKFLTVIATMFIPLSFLAGLFGMNFNPAVSPWNMPELNWEFGYPYALGLMAATAITLLIFFWRNGWLGYKS